MLRVCSFESRKQAEMASLIRRQGGEATVVASMQEVPLEDNRAVWEFAEALRAGSIDVVVFLTGVGAKAVLQVVETRSDRDDFFAALRGCVRVVRGPKPAVVLREWGTPADFVAAEPNTWREILTVFETSLLLSGKTVAVQEYGQPASELHAALAEQGAEVISVPVYRWELPDDIGPLSDAIQATIAGRFDVLLFTSANQLNNVLEVAEKAGKDAWLAAAQKCVIGSIGPTASERVRSFGLTVDVEPEHPKMGHLVRETLEAAPQILSQRSGD